MMKEVKKYIIAIDGPAASGKSTTAKLLAKTLQYVYIDTGAMYRACALNAVWDGIGLTDVSKLEVMLSKIQIEIQYCADGNRIFLLGHDVTDRIREADISRLSSDISQIGIVRARMVELQREMGKEGGVVMDGRDIGTVVFPHADYKFYMIADVHTRALRRWSEAKEKGERLDLSEVEKEILWRDKNDSERALAPLRKAEDAIEIDTSTMTIDEQVSLILKFMNVEKR